MARSIRLLCALVAFALVALLQAAPATAWSVHEVAHLGTQVAAETHHHHEEDGSIEIADHANGDRDSDPDGGHDHLASVAPGVSGMPSEMPTVSALQDLSELAPPSALATAPPNRPQRPQIRPPRRG